MKNQTTILITGGAGFIGANLVHALLKKESAVWTLKQVQGDKRTHIHVLAEPGTDYWRLTNLDWPASHSSQSDGWIPACAGMIQHEINLTDYARVTALVHSIKPNVIYHLASFGGMPNQLKPTMIYDVNLYGTINLLNACKDVGFDCFINTGSSSEYGMKEMPMHEDMVLAPVSDYGVAKAAATQFCLKEALANKLPVYTIRPFAVYGDYELHTRLIPTVITNALANTPVQLSSPHFVRDYIYVADLVDLYLAVASQRPTDAHVFNGGTGVQSTIQDVIDTVQALYGRRLDVRWGAHTPRPWEPRRWQADIGRAQAILGWQARHDLKAGLETSMRWFKQHRDLYFSLDSRLRGNDSFVTLCKANKEIEKQ